MTTCTVERYTPSDWPHVAALLGTWPFKPLVGHARWPAMRVTALCLARATGTLQSPQTVAWTAGSGATVVGFASLSTLPWDSEQIGLLAARLDYLVATGTYHEQYQVKQGLLKAVLEYCFEHDIKHLSARLDASDLSSVHTLEQAGFILVDGILTFALDLHSVSLAEPSADIHQTYLVNRTNSVHIRLATLADGEAASELARQVYIYDRFHSDPAIPTERADGLHATWLRNSCAGGAADAVILGEDNQGLLGFVTCKLQRDTEAHLGKRIGTVVLVATAHRARRRGIARAITLAALNWFRQQNTDLVEVGTQLRNIPASRLYESCGFRLAGSSVSLRKLW